VYDRDLMDLSIVIPVLNEQENILPLLTEIRVVFDGLLNYEVIFVDDGSSDGTLEKLKTAGASFLGVRIISHRKSCGQSSALRTGIKAAKSPWVATLDGDGQNDPADITALYSRINEPASNKLWLIVGWRINRKDNWVKRHSSKIANFVRSRVLNDTTPDSGCGLKLIRREVFLELPYFDHMHRFLPALVMRAGGRVESIEVNHRPRQRGFSKYGTWDRLWVGITDLIGVGWLQRRATLPEVAEYECD